MSSHAALQLLIGAAGILGYVLLLALAWRDGDDGEREARPPEREGESAECVPEMRLAA